MRILASPAFKNRRTNPYNAALYGAMRRPGLVIDEWTNRRLLLERWDIVHLHWPDGVLGSPGVLPAASRILHLVARLIYAKIRGAKIVWTIHNLHAHNTSHPVLERCLWRAFVPLVDAAISLSHAGSELARQRFPALGGKRHFVIPHGHYRDCYENDCTRSEARERLGLPPSRSVIGFVGQIKPYKNVPSLLRAFLEGPGQGSTASLLIAGKPDQPALADELTALAGERADVACRFGHVPDDDMQFVLNACDLAVFPYRDILNSGSAILALSFHRPVLVPAKGAMAELRELVGPEWVMTYEGELTGAVLQHALRWAVESPRPATCDLTLLDWETTSEQTLAAYRSVTPANPVPSCANPAGVQP